MQPLLRNISYEGEWPVQGEAFIELFGDYVEFSVEDQADLAYVERCVAYFNGLDAAIVDELCRASIRYCHAFLDAIGEEAPQFASPRDVLRLVLPGELIIPDERIPERPVVHMELDCEWELEHGMEWLIREDEVWYVGGFCGHDSWEEPRRGGSNYA